MSLGESEDYLIETTPHAMQRVADDEWQLIGEWAAAFCQNIDAPFAIGFFKDSIAVVAPPRNEVFCHLYVNICSGQLASVT